MNQGLIKLIVLIIIGIIILSVLGINLESILKSKLVQKNFLFLWNGLKSIWDVYLKGPAEFVWGIFYNYLWLSFIENMERIKEGRGPDFTE